MIDLFINIYLFLNKFNCQKNKLRCKNLVVYDWDLTNHKILQESERDLTMKFWRLMGFITTGGPAVRGHAWIFLSVSSNHSLVETVLGVVPPNIFESETEVSQIHATPNDAITAEMIYLVAMLKLHPQVCYGEDRSLDRSSITRKERNRTWVGRRADFCFVFCFFVFNNSFWVEMAV